MARTRRRRVFPVAALLGVVVGFGLLSQLQPQVRDTPTRLVTEPVRTELTVRRAAPVPAAEPSAPPAPEAFHSLDHDQAEPDVEPEAASDEVTLIVDIVDDEGRPTDRAWVQPVDCPGFRGTGAGEFAVSPGTCVVRGVRRDGALLARTPVTPIAIAVPGPVYAQLTLTSKRTGGIGVQFRPVEGGMRVVHVVEGTPAWKAGLEVGDLILEVAGESVQGLSAQGFVDAMTGPEGTEIEFVVGLQSDTGLAEDVVKVRRAFLDG